MTVIRFKDYPHKIVNEFDKTIRFPDFAYYFGGKEGGKVAGLKDFREAVLANQERIKREFGDLVHFVCPKTSVLETNLFESFMEKNDLWKIIESQPGEKEIFQKFLDAKFTSAQRATLRFILNDLEAGHIRPVVVRSSSLNEDAERASFAGIYKSVLLPNCHPDEEIRLKQFETSIKLVFASVFSDAAITYRKNKGIPEGSERMAIALQNMVGRLWKLRNGEQIYHPELSFAAFSYNDYPIYGASAKEGITRIAFGLGTGVVENDVQTAIKVQLGKPLTVYEMYDAKQAAQIAPRYFYALSFKADEQMPLDETFYLIKCHIGMHANEELIARHRMFYYDESFRLQPPREGAYTEIFTFSNIIKGIFGNNVIKIISFLNQILQEHFGVYVDFEGAFDFIRGRDNKTHTVCYILQARPQIRGDLARVKVLPEIEEERILLKLEKVIGRGKQTFQHIVLVKREHFNHKTANQLAEKIREKNQALSKEGEDGKYLLFVPGRIGSRDNSLGIPCDFSHINHSVGVIELIEGNWVPSQGTHMFEAMVGAGMTLGHYPVEKLELKRMAKYGKSVSDEGGIIHFTFEKPLRLIVDEEGRGIIYQS